MKTTIHLLKPSNILGIKNYIGEITFDGTPERTEEIKKFLEKEYKIE